MINDLIMRTLKRKATLCTPNVQLDCDKNTYLISGRSYPLEADLFYLPILNWFDDLLASDIPNSIQFKVNLEYLNIASSKRIMFLFYKLIELQNAGCQVLVRWMYNSEDPDMLEIGHDYSIMTEDLHFIFEPYQAKKPVSKSAVLSMN